MKSHLPLFILSFSLVLLANLPSFRCAYNYNSGYTIQDLDSNLLPNATSDGCFIQETSTWTASNLINNIPYFVCNGSLLLGGYNILGPAQRSTFGQYFSKTFQSLQPHNMIYFSFTLYQIDTLDPNDAFSIVFDSVAVTNAWRIPWIQITGQKNYCGASAPDIPNMRVFGRAPHSAATLTLKFLMQNDEASNNESYGFRDLHLILATTSDLVAMTQTMCVVTSQAFSAGNCQCAEGYYSDANLTCQTCNPACSSCFGPSSSQCYRCASGTGWNGTACVPCDSSCGECSGSSASQCATCSPGNVLYNNQHCVISEGIKTPLSTNSDSCGNSYSTSPCDSSEFLLWDSSCSPSCEFPLQQEVISSSLSYCLYSCSLEQYLYWNGTCGSTCLFPLRTTVRNGMNFCDYGCNNSEYLYYNGSCNSSCPPPLTTRLEAGRNYCDYPCLADQYLYWDSSCQSTCNTPLSAMNYSGALFCSYSCLEKEFLYWNGTCGSSCKLPLTTVVLNNKRLCNYTCTAGQYLHSNGTCLNSCVLPLIAREEAGEYYCSDPPVVVVKAVKPVMMVSDNNRGTCGHNSGCHNHCKREHEQYRTCEERSRRCRHKSRCEERMRSRSQDHHQDHHGHCIKRL